MHSRLRKHIPEMGQNTHCTITVKPLFKCVLDKICCLDTTVFIDLQTYRNFDNFKFAVIKIFRYQLL